MFLVFMVGFLYFCGAVRQWIALKNEEILLSALAKQPIRMINWQGTLASVLWPLVSLYLLYLVLVGKKDDDGRTTETVVEDDEDINNGV